MRIQLNDHAHREKHKAIQRHSTTPSATYLAQNRAQIPSSSRSATVDLHRSSFSKLCDRLTGVFAFVAEQKRCG
jgi:hypothetical protein